MSSIGPSEVDGSGEMLSRLDVIRLRLVESIDTEPAGEGAPKRRRRAPRLRWPGWVTSILLCSM